MSDNRTIDDGGPAFPNITPDMRINGGPGMSLRDWFAGQALAGLLHGSGYGAELRRIFDKDDTIASTGDERETPQHYTARIALSLADAVIAARGGAK